MALEDLKDDADARAQAKSRGGLLGILIFLGTLFFLFSKPFFSKPSEKGNVEDTSLHDDIKRELRQDLDRRADILDTLSNFIFVAIVFLIVGAFSVIYFADRLTSDELSSLSKKIRSIALDEVDALNNLGPSIVKIRRNIDRVTGAFSPYIREIPGLDAGANFNDDDARDKYSFYGYMSSADFYDKDSLLKLLDHFKNWPTKTAPGKSDKDVIVARYDSLYEDVADKKLSRIYIWGFRKKSIDDMIQAVKDLQFPDEIKEAEGKKIQSYIDKVFALRVEISSLQKVLSDINPSIDSGKNKTELVKSDSKDNNEASDKSQGVSEVKERGAQPSVEPSNYANLGYFLLQLNINKFGLITMALVLIGLLISVYKYYKRLSAFYRSRAHAIWLLPALDEPEKFAQLADSLSPSAIGFGRLEEKEDLRILAGLKKLGKSGDGGKKAGSEES